MPWIGSKRGQAGHWGEVPFEWYWTGWVNEWAPADRQHVCGGTITACGRRPIMGTKDPCLGMSGAVWDFYFVIIAPSCCVRTLFVHLSADGSMDRVCTLPEVERVSA